MTCCDCVWMCLYAFCQFLNMGLSFRRPLTHLVFPYENICIWMAKNLESLFGKRYAYSHRILNIGAIFILLLTYILNRTGLRVPHCFLKVSKGNPDVTRKLNQIWMLKGYLSCNQINRSTTFPSLFQ